MSGVKLPVDIYNDFFINCTDNHLLGLLVMRDESFRKAVCSVQTVYSMLAPKPGGEAEIPEAFHQQGHFLLQIDFERLDLEDWFEFRQLDMRQFPGIHQGIQEHLQQGLYCMVYLDRYHFPGGIEYHRRHTIHPSFIYGYDADEQTYLLIEDCAQFGKMEHYKLSFADLEIAHRAVQEAGLFLDSRVFRMREDREYRYALPKQALLDNFTNLLQEEVRDHIEAGEKPVVLAKHTGMSCIEKFADRVGEVYTRLGQDFIHQFISAGRPLQAQRKNLLILKAMEPTQHVERLERKFRELAGHWEIYRNRLFKYILLRDRYPEVAQGSINFAELQEVLHTIYPVEQKWTRELVELLQEEKSLLV